MRNTAIGALLVAGLWMAVGAAEGQPRPVFGPATASTPAAELVSFAMPAGENRQLLTVIDPRTKAMSVYHVDLPTGRIALKSVRNIQWDLALVEWNGVEPLPREIRSMLETR